MMENLSEEDLMGQEDRCRSAMKTVAKAIFMRLFVTVLLVWVLLKTSGQIWIIGMMVLVVIVNLSGMLPLAAEWKKCRKELRSILDQYE